VAGRGNTLRDCTFRVRGSFPYGYGDLFGKGGPNVINPLKKSGVLVTGDGTTLVGCRLYMRAFGHGYFVQKDASDVRFEDCSVEGEMRPTEQMLAETSGPAFEKQFRTVGKNREGANRILPGYVKSLAEDGFRTYGRHRNLTFKNCTATNMRGGFELRTREGVRLENCTAVGNERGFWVSSGVKMIGCKGDARFGPLLFVEGEGANVDLELLPAESDRVVHALATVHGSGHRVSIKPSGGERTRAIPIVLGYGTPGAGEGMAPIPEREAKGVTLVNGTLMPVVVGAKASDCELLTRGPVRENAGKGILVKQQ